MSETPSGGAAPVQPFGQPAEPGMPPAMQGDSGMMSMMSPEMMQMMMRMMGHGNAGQPGMMGRDMMMGDMMPKDVMMGGMMMQMMGAMQAGAALPLVAGGFGRPAAAAATAAATARIGERKVTKKESPSVRTSYPSASAMADRMMSVCRYCAAR